MTWTVILLRDVRPVPWRNGGGTTRELLAIPDSDDWAWRISVAEVASDGAFSHCPGVQRWLAILSGAGVRLTTPEHAIELAEASEPLVFNGATPVQCELLQGPVQDLNLMLRCDDNLWVKRHVHSEGDSVKGPVRCIGVMRRFCGAQRIAVEQASTVAIYANHASAILQIDGGEQYVVAPAALAWRVLPAGAVLTCVSSSAFLFEISTVQV